MDEKMGPSEFYGSVPDTSPNMVGDPIAVDLAAPTTVHLGSPGSLEHLPSSSELHYS
jgi:hypothetical protein